MAAPVTFSEFVSALADLGSMAREDAVVEARIAAVVDALREIGPPSRDNLAMFVELHPDAVPVLATCVGLTQEQLKNQLSHRLGSSGWTTLARKRSAELIGVLDADFNLIALLTKQLDKQWSFSDVLLERYLWSRRGAANAVGQGRNVEDEVEAVVTRLGIAAQPRTRFTGRGGATGPCDLAMPSGGDLAQIVVAMKGFNSTGSKLSDAVREIEDMANVRLPNQYVFAVIDGIGWKNRQADLNRIYELWRKKSIDGLYALAHLDRFEVDLTSAARRLDLIPQDHGDPSRIITLAIRRRSHPVPLPRPQVLGKLARHISLGYNGMREKLSIGIVGARHPSMCVGVKEKVCHRI